MGLFGPKLLNTTIEVLCQTTGQTITITSNKPRKCVRCWKCTDDKGASESFEVLVKPGKGNVVVIYYDKAGGSRQLEKIVPDHSGEDKHARFGLAQYTATGGTFILLSQEKV